MREQWRTPSALQSRRISLSLCLLDLTLVRQFPTLAPCRLSRQHQLTTLSVPLSMLVQTLAVHHQQEIIWPIRIPGKCTPCPRRPQGVQPSLTVVIDNDVRPRTTSRKLSKPYLRYHARLAPPRVRVACADDVDWTVHDRRTRQMRTQRAKVQDIQGIRPRNRDELREKGVLLESGPCTIPLPSSSCPQLGKNYAATW